MALDNRYSESQEEDEVREHLDEVAIIVLFYKRQNVV